VEKDAGGGGVSVGQNEIAAAAGVKKARGSDGRRKMLRHWHYFGSAAQPERGLT